MKLLKMALLCSVALGLNLAARADDFYIAQSSLGTGDGSSAANAQSVAWLNTAGNWGSNAGQIKAGDTIHLTGTITNQININGSGVAGSVITIYFEPGAKLSQPAGSLVSASNRRYIVFDGGQNGILENTDNGTLLGHQLAVSGIYASGSDNLEVKNLLFQNFYVHPQPAQTNYVEFVSNGAIYMNGFGSNISIHNNNFSNICWVLNLGGGAGSGANIYSNNFVNYDHGVAGLGNAYSNVNIFNNHFGSTAIWDTGTNNYYHHDGIHIFFGAGSTLSGVQIYNNLFDGNWGINNTAHIYCEGDFTHANPNAMSDFRIYNNVFIQSPGNYLNNGFAGGGGPNWAWYNNTFVGAGVYNASGIGVGGSNLIVKNNLFSGVNTFINLVGTNAVTFNNNIYANQGPGGNSPWWRGAGISSFKSWQLTTGGDASAIFTSLPVVHADGTLLTNSVALGAGADLSAIFQTDITGAIRPAQGWTSGAFQSSSGIVPAGLVPVKPVSPKNLRILKSGSI